MTGAAAGPLKRAPQDPDYKSQDHTFSPSKTSSLSAPMYGEEMDPFI